MDHAQGADGRVAIGHIGARFAARSFESGQQMLDIGCGTGASCLAAAGFVGPAGHVTGVDVAAQLLDRAGIRAKAAGIPNITLQLADAQTHACAPASIDVIISRFGVMFFEDPVVAFANMARALKPGGRLVFAAWAPPAQVPWFSIPASAVIARLGKPAPSDPNAPGPMAFQNPDRVIKLLADAGLKNLRCQTETVDLTPSGPFNEVTSFATRVGPAARIIADFSGTDADTAAIEADVRSKFAAFNTDKGLRIPAGIHLYCASGPNA